MVNIALVGAGGRGLRNAGELLKLADARIVAIADPAEYWDLNKFYYKGTAGRRPTREAIEKVYRRKQIQASCTEYEDFRVMLERESGLDAVLCATPDHLHATVSLAAMRAGNIFTAKSRSHTTWPRRAWSLLRLARLASPRKWAIKGTRTKGSV